MNKKLLIEIIVEELPAISFLKELPNIMKKWDKILQQNDLSCKFDFYYTPRRLVLFHNDFQLFQANKTIEQFGAPVRIAFKEGKPTNAALSFAKKFDIDINKIETINTEKGEVLYHKQIVKGKKSTILLNNMVNNFVDELNFGKSMKWGNLDKKFIRPIRSLSIVLGDELVLGELYSVQSSKQTFCHRMISYDSIDFDTVEEYFTKLNNNGIILFQEKRRKIILEQIKNLEIKHDLDVKIDLELLNEIVVITEYPTALIGTFDENFLSLPQEVIISSMKEHQKYFPIYKNNTITNKFIVVSNAYTNDFDEIISGNEKVIRARLEDAMFFYNNDIRKGLDNESLKKVIFVDGLGSMFDKIVREVKVSKELAIQLNMQSDIKLLEKTIMMSKSDLLSDMVYEFTDLQGIMGYYYAKANNENLLLCEAIRDQYLPIKNNGKLPQNKFSSIVAISVKLDNIISLFGIGMIPTGSRDPFALRRAASGIIKICIEHKINLDLKLFVNNSIIDFFYERYYKIFSHINPSIINSIIKTKESKLLNITNKILALNKISSEDTFREFSSTFKRISNIIKDVNVEEKLNVDDKLFEFQAENDLYLKFKQIKNTKKVDYNKELENLFSIKPQLDNFFDKVFVNCEDVNIKRNRQHIIANIYKLFLKIADIKYITI